MKHLKERSPQLLSTTLSEIEQDDVRVTDSRESMLEFLSRSVRSNGQKPFLDDIAEAMKVVDESRLPPNTFPIPQFTFLRQKHLQNVIFNKRHPLFTVNEYENLIKNSSKSLLIFPLQEVRIEYYEVQTSTQRVTSMMPLKFDKPPQHLQNKIAFECKRRV
jgi:hypothetical protein